MIKFMLLSKVMNNSHSLSLGLRLLDLFRSRDLLFHSFCVGEDVEYILVVLLDPVRTLLWVEGERVSVRLRSLGSHQRISVGGHNSEVMDPVELAVEARHLDLLQRSIVNLFGCEESHQLCLSRGVVTSQDGSQEAVSTTKQRSGVHERD